MLIFLADHPWQATPALLTRQLLEKNYPHLRFFREICTYKKLLKTTRFNLPLKRTSFVNNQRNHSGNRPGANRVSPGQQLRPPCHRWTPASGMAPTRYHLWDTPSPCHSAGCINFFPARFSRTNQISLHLRHSGRKTSTRHINAASSDYSDRDYWTGWKEILCHTL